MRKTISLFLIILVLFLSTEATYATSGSLLLKITFDKPFYATDDFFTSTISLNNNSGQLLKGVRLFFTIKDQPKTEESSSPYSSKLKSTTRILYARSWVRNLEVGELKLLVKEKVSSLGLREGNYPVSVKVSQRGKTLLEETSSLVIVDSHPYPPLKVVLFLNFDAGIHVNSDGAFVDKTIQGYLSRDNRKRGLYQRYLDLLIKYPGIKATVNISPYTLKQIEGISNGYSLKEKGRLRKVPASSKEAKYASLFLKSFRHLVKTGQIELVPSSCTSAPLGVLAQEGFNQDIIYQIEEGRKVVAKILGVSDKFNGVYLPNFDFNLKLVPYLEKTKTSYFVLEGKAAEGISPKPKRVAQAGKENLYRPCVVASSSKNPPVVLFRDDFSSQELMREEVAEMAAQRMLGQSCVAYLSPGTKEKAIVVAFDVGDKEKTISNFEWFLQVVGQVPWLRTSFLSEAIKTTPFCPEAVSVREKKERQSTVSYFRELAGAREAYYLYSRVAENPTLERKLFENLQVAESGSWLVQKSLREKGKANFIQPVIRKVREEFDKLSLAQNQVITLTGSSGKIPIAVGNKADYKMRVTIVVEGKGLDFPQGNSQAIELAQQENLTTFLVNTKTRRATAKVTLKSDGQVLKETLLIVKGNLITRRTAAYLIGLLILSAGIILFWRYLRVKKVKARKVGGA